MWMRTAPNKPFEFLVSVVELEYDDVRGGWNYIVKYEKDGAGHPGSVEETNLRRASGNVVSGGRQEETKKKEETKKTEETKE